MSTSLRYRVVNDISATSAPVAEGDLEGAPHSDPDGAPHSDPKGAPHRVQITA